MSDRHFRQRVPQAVHYFLREISRKGVRLERKLLGGSNSRERWLGAEASFLGAISKRGNSALGLSELAKGTSTLRLPSTLKLRSCARHVCSHRVAAQPMELAKRINSDTASSEFKQVVFFTSPCILQIRLGIQGSQSALSDADSSFVGVC
jgi:hypothetical protein